MTEPVSITFEKVCDDKELSAIHIILELFKGMEYSEKQRVIQYVQSKSYPETQTGAALGLGRAQAIDC